MFFDESLHLFLKTNIPNVKAYPCFIPEGQKLPAISYQKISANYSHSLQGDTGFVDALWQISIYGDDPLTTKTIAKQVRLLLQNFSGLMGDIEIQGVLLEDNNDGYDDESNSYHEIFEFRFFYIDEV